MNQWAEKSPAYKSASRKKPGLLICEPKSIGIFDPKSIGVFDRKSVGIFDAKLPPAEVVSWGSSREGSQEAWKRETGRRRAAKESKRQTGSFHPPPNQPTTLKGSRKTVY